MILGISSYTYGWAVGHAASPMNEAHLVDEALRFEVRCLQLGDNIPLAEFPEARLQKLDSLASHHGLRLEVGARKLDATTLNRYISIAQTLHAPLIRFVIDDEGYTPHTSDVIAILKEHRAELERHQLVVGIENHDRFKAHALASIVEAVASNSVGICLDCANSLGAGEGLNEVFATLAPYTVNFHMKDFTIDRLPHKMGFTVSGAPAGKGMANMLSLLDKLPPGKCASAILEQWVVPAENIEATIRKERLWAAESMAFLKQWPHWQ